MERHPHFDLWLHSTDELSSLLAIEIVERTTLHEWPLSCVQKLRLSDGRQLIYKSQFHEGVEAQFYTQASSHLLPWHQLVGNYENSFAMFLEFIDAPRLEDVELTNDEILSHGHRILADIADIDPGVPVYQDISTPEKWSLYTDDTLAKLQMLIEEGIFVINSLDTVHKLADWVKTQNVLSAIQSESTLIHCDLSGDNIFLTEDGLRVIDWQYPRRAPAEVDWACYIEGMGLDPLEYADPIMIKLLWFIRLNWFVECKTRLFPPGECYDQQAADMAQSILAE